MLRRLELPEHAHRQILARCEQRGIIFLSSSFDEASADFLEALGVPAFKIPSGELTNLPFLAHVARKGRPMIVSTGMSTLAEVEAAITTVEAHGTPALVLLHCVSTYPAQPSDVNLRAMATMRAAFGVPVGYSDHTEGDEIALAAVALGACVLEKHFTLDRGLPGPDQQASIEPPELAALVRRVRAVEAALGDGSKAPAARETSTASVARKSLVLAQHIEAGAILTADMVVARRPGTGIPPSRLAEVVGRAAVADIPIGTVLRWEMLR
jgi:sialic acid synthase SpsE